jgi:hypothetical protein
VTLSYATADGTATAGGSGIGSNDYQAASGTLTFAPGQTSQSVTVLVNGDVVAEPNETFFLNLSAPTNATLADAQGQGTIVNDDTAQLAVSDTSVTEGNSGTTTAAFTVKLTTPSAATVTVDYATADGTATAGSDYAAAGGTLTFAPGEISQAVNVTVNGDTLNEADETFFLNLSNPAGASILDSQGVGTIVNDDPLPALSVNDVSVTEGNSGTTPATFTVTLSAPSGRPVTVQYATADGTAAAGGTGAGSNDYQAASGTLTFNPGETAKTVPVLVNGDTLREPDETFFLNLSGPGNATLADGQGLGTIVNDDLGKLTVSVAPHTFAENAGANAATGTVTRSNVSDLSQPLAVALTSSDTTAATVPGSVIIPAGQASVTFPVNAVDDTLFDGTQTATITALAAGFTDGSDTVQVTDNEGKFFDFGTSSSPVAAGYTRVTDNTNFSTSLGYGWVSGIVKSRDRGTSDPLTRDFNYTTGATFGVNLPNGTYKVTLTSGDATAAHDQEAIYLEGNQVDLIGTAAGQFVVRTYTVTVSDGQLTLRLKDLGGSDKDAVINALTITAP